jgi:hypothetical protein
MTQKLLAIQSPERERFAFSTNPPHLPLLKGGIIVFSLCEKVGEQDEASR